MRGEGCRCGTDSSGRLGRRTAAAAFLVALFAAMPASGFPGPDRVSGSATVVVHGQGRVTSEPAGTIDCPGTCSFSFTGSRSLTLRAAPATGWATGENAFCGAVDTCAVSLNDSTHTLHVYFRPRAKVHVWPNGSGSVSLSPTPADARGEPDPAPCPPPSPFDVAGCEYYYLPGTTVTATAAPVAPSTFHGWSAHTCPGTGDCALTLARDESTLVARFTPLEVRVVKEGITSGSVVSEPAGIACPPSCEAAFPYGSEVTLVARPSAAAPFLSWKFGCAPSPADPRRCVLTATNRVNWIGVALGEDADIGEPATLSVLFDVVRRGNGEVKGRELACPSTCEREYVFGTREELKAVAAAGWRFTGWTGACGRQDTCALHVGPVTSIVAGFAENLVPRLLGVQPAGRGDSRKLRVRLGVRHAARARLQLRRAGAPRVLAQRIFPLRGGVSTVVLGVPRGTKPGRLRLTIAVSDDQGGGRTFHRVVRIGP